MKRYFQIISVSFAFIFFLSVSPSFYCQATSNYELTYKVNEDETITVTGCIADVDELIIPSEIDGHHVSKIGARAFGVTDSELYSNKECFCTVRSLIIEEGISEIEYAAFMNCKNLRTISLPKTLITVRDRAFYGCDNLKCVTIPDKIELIAEESFGYTTNLVYNSIDFNDDTQSIPLEDFMILGWQNSTAEIYAKENEFNFISIEDDMVPGDVNDDRAFNISDVVLLQKWLLAVPDTHLANWKAADFCEDNALNVFDLCLMKRALIEQRISEGQPVLYCEGEKIGESDEKGWYSTEYSNVITDKQLKDNPDILSRLDKVNAKADELKSTQMIDWKWGVEDYGEDYLYLPYVDENGNADRILLCKFGWDCAWLDDADVQMLVSMLIGNGYYADKTLFEYYIEDQ